MSVNRTASCLPTMTRSTFSITRSVVSLISRTDSDGRSSSFTRVRGPNFVERRPSTERGLRHEPHSFLNFPSRRSHYCIGGRHAGEYSHGHEAVKNAWQAQELWRTPPPVTGPSTILAGFIV